jgi:hypothetical protein
MYAKARVNVFMYYRVVRFYVKKYFFAARRNYARRNSRITYTLPASVKLVLEIKNLILVHNYTRHNRMKYAQHKTKNKHQYTVRTKRILCSRIRNWIIELGNTWYDSV